jgi:hypothetical protein
MKKFIGKYKKGGNVTQDFIEDDRGQWAHPGKNTLINSNQITMKGVDYPVLGTDDLGNSQMMYPGANYTFPGNKVYEIPMAQDGVANTKPYTRIPSIEDSFQGINPNETQVFVNPDNTEDYTFTGERPIDWNTLLHRQAYRESSFLDKHVFGPEASPAGAQGIAQFMPRTSQDLKRLNFVDDNFNPYDPKQAAEAQRKYMDWLGERPYLKKGRNDVQAAKRLAAYNWGPGAVKNYLTSAKEKGYDIYNSFDWVEGLPKETRNYVNEILLNQNADFEKDYENNKSKYSEHYFKQRGGLVKMQGDVRGSTINSNLNNASKYNFPIYSTATEFYEKNKNLKTHIKSKENIQGTNINFLKGAPYPKNSEAAKNNIDDWENKTLNYAYQESLYDDDGESICVGEQCTARANRAISVLNDQSGTTFFENPDKSKKDFNAEYSVARQPTQKEIEKYPYFQGDTEFGSLDAWDIVHQADLNTPDNVLYKNIYWNPGATKEEMSKASKERLENLKTASNIWKEYDIPVGSYINLGNHHEDGIIAGSHTVRVVGYKPDGEPIVADYGEIKPISRNIYGPEAEVAGVVSIPGKEKYTYKHFQDKINKAEKPVDINESPYISDINTSKNTESGFFEYLTGSDKKYGEDFKTFHDALVTEKSKIDALVGIDSEKYDEYAKLALTIAGVETEFGKGVSYKFADFGDSTGVSQLNFDNVKEKYKKTLKQYEGTDQYDAVATLLYIGELDKYKDKWHELGQNAQERPFRRTDYSVTDSAKRGVRDVFQGRDSQGYIQSVNPLESDTFTDDKGKIDIPFKQPWQNNKEYEQEVNKHLTDIGRNDLRFAHDDKENRTIYRKTTGTTIPKTLKDILLYAWQSPNAIRYGDAQGDSNYYKKGTALYDELFNNKNASEKTKTDDVNVKRRDLGKIEFQPGGSVKMSNFEPKPYDVSEDYRYYRNLTDGYTPKPTHMYSADALSKEDTSAENLYEWLDPTGISSHDDAYRAYKQWKSSGRDYPTVSEGLDVAGALPLVGKLKALGSLQKFIKTPKISNTTKTLSNIENFISTAGFVEDETKLLENADTYFRNLPSSKGKKIQVPPKEEPTKFQRDLVSKDLKPFIYTPKHLREELAAGGPTEPPYNFVQNIANDKFNLLDKENPYSEYYLGDLMSRAYSPNYDGIERPLNTVHDKHPNLEQGIESLRNPQFTSEGYNLMLDRKFSDPRYKGDGFDEIKTDWGGSKEDANKGKEYLKNKRYSEELKKHNVGGSINKVFIGKFKT